jgi:hypothetical protein
VDFSKLALIPLLICALKEKLFFLGQVPYFSEIFFLSKRKKKKEAAALEV